MGHEVYIFTIETTEDDKIDSPYVIYFKGFTVPLKKLRTYKISIKARFEMHKVKKYNLDVIHVQTEFSMAKIAIAAAKHYHIPLVYTLHTLYEDYLSYFSKTMDEYFHKSLLASLTKLIIYPINKVANIKIVPTRKTLAVISKYHIDGDIRVIPTGIDFDYLINKKKDEAYINNLKEELNISKDDVVYLYLGRISSEKTIDELIDCFSDAYKINNNMTFIIIGDGSELDNLKEQAKNLNIPDDKIKFLGFIEWKDIVPYYQMADAFLNSSQTETQGLTYIEALVCGTPIIVKYDEILDDIVKEGQNGFFYYEKPELVNLLVRFANDKQYLRDLKNFSLDNISNYNAPNFAKNILKVYESSIIKKNKLKK